MAYIQLFYVVRTNISAYAYMLIRPSGMMPSICYLNKLQEIPDVNYFTIVFLFSISRWFVLGYELKKFYYLHVPFCGLHRMWEDNIKLDIIEMGFNTGIKMIWLIVGLGVHTMMNLCVS
jgi:hypothetical protein